MLVIALPAEKALMLELPIGEGTRKAAKSKVAEVGEGEADARAEVRVGKLRDRTAPTAAWPMSGTDD